MVGIITTAGKNIYINRAFETAPTESYIKYFQIGMCAKSATVTDTKLWAPIPIVTTNVAIIDACDATTGWSTGGDSTAVSVDSTVGEYMEGTGCLKLPTTYSAGTANWYKTVTNFDVTSKYFTIMLYVTNLADITSGASAIKIDIGTGGFTNYNSYNFDKTLLQVGWNALVCDGDTPDSSSGSGATKTTINRIKMTITNANTWVTNETRMDWIQTYPKADTLGVWVGGYPVYNTTNKSVAIQGQDLSTNTNGYYIREFGLLNNDSPKLLYSRDTFTTIIKSQFISLTFNQTDSFT